MRPSRRALLAGSAASLVASRIKPAEAWLHPGKAFIGTGWNILPLGAGGLVTGLHIANDGSMVCRTDVGNIYRWSGKGADYADPNQKWIPLVSIASLANFAAPNMATVVGGFEHVLAPGNSNVHLAIIPDVGSSPSANKQILVYGTWTGSSIVWSATGVAFLNDVADTNSSPYKILAHKVAIDPVNANVAYCGAVHGDGNTAGVYTSLNQAGGSTLTTWAAVTTNGVTPIAAPSIGLSCGIVIDPSLGTTTVGGQTVTSRVILPVGGVGIYESIDGGQTFTEIAVTPFGSSNFYVVNGVLNSAGVYYCVVSSSVTGVWGLWRYRRGDPTPWVKISPAAYNTSGFYGPGTMLLVDPRTGPSNQSYLSITGPNGIGAGYTSTNADTGAPPAWGGLTGGEIPWMQSKAYDIPWINYVFGQQHANAFANGTCAQMDVNMGIGFWGGNQSFFYFGTSSTDETPNGWPTYSAVNVSTYSWSMGRGQESIVSQDILCPLGATYPVLAAQDVGGPMRGTFTSYPTNQSINFSELAAENLEYSGSDPGFVVASVTGQQNSPGVYYGYSGFMTGYGDPATYQQYGNDTTGKSSNQPASMYRSTITASITSNIVTVTAISGGCGLVLPRQDIFTHGVAPPSSALASIAAYGTSGTTGVGGLGTYALVGTTADQASTQFDLWAWAQGGVIVAPDNDHHVAVVSGNGSNWQYVPLYSTNPRAASNVTWNVCQLTPGAGGGPLPIASWTQRGWNGGPTCKPFAVGYGSDLGMVWAWLTIGGNSTGTLYWSQDYGATFAPIASITIGANSVGPFCLSVPGVPGDLWLSADFTSGGGIWRVSNANTATPTVTQISNLPANANQVSMLTLGAPSSPGGYPTLYMRGTQIGTGGTAPKYLYKGIYSGSGSTVTWSLFGGTGTVSDYPITAQIDGITAIRGDWNVYERLYAATVQQGFIYYNP